MKYVIYFYSIKMGLLLILSRNREIRSSLFAAFKNAK